MLDYAYEDVQYYEWIGDVIKYAHSNYNAEVDLLAEDSAFVYELKKNKIHVKGATPLRDKLYILLHEVGHLFRFNENMQDSTYFMDKSGEQNITEKTMTLMEEVLAWHKAEDIADRLNIPIEKRAWQRLINKSVSEYVDWACDKEI